MADKSTNDKSMGQTSSVISDKDFARYTKLKLEKLASASYVVTNFLSDTEPLKWKIREKAIEMVSYINQGQFDVEKGHELASYKLINTLQQIIALLEMGLVSESVSQMNFRVLKQEYQSALEGIRQYIARSFEASVEMPTLLPESPEVPQPLPGVSAGVSKDSNYVSHKPSHTQTKQPTVSHPPASSLSNKDKTDRQEKIKTFLQGRGWTAIKDIARLVPGVSVKTIQRELSDMVDSGVLKKKGERRWSRYMVNQ